MLVEWSVGVRLTGWLGNWIDRKKRKKSGDIS